MTQVTDYAALSAELDKLLFSGGVSNGLPSADALRQAITEGALFTEALPGGLLLLRRRAEHLRLNFLLREPAALEDWTPPPNVVLELPRRQRDTALPELAKALTGRGWKQLLQRIRLSRRGAAAEGEHTDCDARDDARVLQILERCFSPVTGCLPTPAELEAEETILCSGGALHYRRSGRTTELRHLAVLPECRGQGLARRLIAAYLEREGSLLSRVWVDPDNVPALHLYQSFGYRQDEWSSQVLLFEGTK